MMWHFKKLGKEQLSDESGYTLLELLVVLVILSLVIGLAGPAVLRQFTTAKSKTAGIEVNRLATNVEFFRVDMGRFPTDEENLTVLYQMNDSDGNWNGPYIQKQSQLQDPWGNDYLYELGSDGDSFRVYSLGADGAEGGTGEDADVSSVDEASLN